jgi:hypothetical protein
LLPTAQFDPSLRESPVFGVIAAKKINKKVGEFQHKFCLTTLLDQTDSTFGRGRLAGKEESHGRDVAAGAARLQQPLLLLPLPAGAVPSARQEVQEDHLGNLPAACGKAHPACYDSNFVVMLVLVLHNVFVVCKYVRVC